MAQRVDKKKYGQRWQVETAVGLVRRLLDAALRARSYLSQCRGISLQAITLQVMILRRRHRGSLQGMAEPFYSPAMRTPSW